MLKFQDEFTAKHDRRLACIGGAGLGGLGSREACSLVSLAVRDTACGGVPHASGDGSGACTSDDSELERVCTCKRRGQYLCRQHSNGKCSSHRSKYIGLCRPA